MFALPLASSHSIVWSVSFSVSWSPSPSFWLTLWGWTHTSRVLYLCMFEVLCSGAGAEFPDYSRPLHNSGVKRFRLSWCQGWLFIPAGLVWVCVSTLLCMEDGRASVPKHFLVFTPPYPTQKGGNSSLLTRVVFPVGWLAIQQSPQECRKSDPKSPGTNKK